MRYRRTNIGRHHEWQHKTRRKTKLYKIVSFIAVFAIIVQTIYPIISFLPSLNLFKKNVILANEDILSTGENEKIMYQNTNPEFKVEFGNKEQADKPFVRFESISTRDNPFDKAKNFSIKENIFERLSHAIYGEKKQGIEFSMQSAETSRPEENKNLGGGTPGNLKSATEPTSGKNQNKNASMETVTDTDQNENQNGNNNENINGNDNQNDNQNGNGNKNGNQNDNNNSNLNDNSGKKLEKQSKNLNENTNKNSNKNENNQVAESNIGTLVKDGNKTSPASAPVESSEETKGNWEKESSVDSPSPIENDVPSALDREALEVQAELQAEEQIYDQLKEQLDQLIKGETANIKTMTPEETADYRETLKTQILDRLTQEAQVNTVTQTAQVENPDDKANKMDIVKNPEVVKGVDVSYRILEEKGLKEDIIIKNLESFSGNCMRKALDHAQNSDSQKSEDFDCSLPKNSFTFSLKLDPGVVMHNAIGTTNQKPYGVTYFTNKEGKYLFHFLPLYAEDATGARSNNVRLVIDPSNKLVGEDGSTTYIMKVIADLSWIMDSSRQFPVKIDPSIVHDTKVEFDAGNSLIRLNSLSTPKVEIKAPTEFGNGGDGTCTVSSGTTNLNTGSCAGRGTADAVNFSVTGNTAPGQNQITVSTTPTGLAAGDEILVINLMGTSSNNSTVGRYETKRIVSIATNTLTLNANLQYQYDGTTQKIMVQRVPNYSNVSISAGATLTANAFDGSKSGVMFFRATGTVQNEGTIDMASKGFRGGGNDTSGPEGYAGRAASGGAAGGAGGTGGAYSCSCDCTCSTNPTAGGNGTSNSGGGGGGGDGGYCTTASGGTGGSRGGGGGGGSNSGGGGGSNGTGGNASSSLTGGGGGGGGSSYSALTNASDLLSDKIIMGGGAAAGASGGGAGGDGGGSPGSAGSAGNPYSSNTGNPGGGIVYISGYAVNLNAVLSVNGGNGGAGTNGGNANTSGGGGGGGNGGNGASGGSVVVKGVAVAFGTVTSSAGSGGAAGSGGSGGTLGGAGGAGSAGAAGSTGYVGVYYQSQMIGTSTPAPSITKIQSFAYDYGDYTSSVLDLGVGLNSIDSLQWNENAVQTGDGETPYSNTGLVAQWNFNDGTPSTQVDTANNDAEGTSCGGTPANCDGTLNGFTNASKTGLDGSVTEGWTANNGRWPKSSPEAVTLDGTDDYITVTNNSALNINGSGSAATINMWVYVKSLPSTWASLFYKGAASDCSETNCSDRQYTMFLNNAGYLHFNSTSVNNIGVTQTYVNTLAGTITAGKWYYISGVIDSPNSVMKIYVNGKLSNSTAYSNTGIRSATGNLHFGQNTDGASRFNAIIDSANIYSRALTDNEILSNYQAGNIEFETRTGTDNTPDDGNWEAWKPSGTGTETQLASMDSDSANWTADYAGSYAKSDDSNIKREGSGSLKLTTGAPQVDANTVGLWRMEETGGSGAYIKDLSGNNNHGTPTGSTLVEGVYGKARSFNGSSEFIGVNDAASLRPSNLSVELWAKSNTSTWNETGFLASKRDNYLIHPNSGATTVNFYIFTTSWQFVACDAGDITNWKNYSMTWDGTTLRAYLNGTQCNSANVTGPISTTGSTPLYIGRDTSEPRYFNGSIDEVRISNIARTSEQIAEAYRMGRDHRISKTVSSTDLSGKTKLPFYIAGDQVGSSIEATVGESAYANYESDANTIGLWHLDEQSGSGAYIKDYSSSGINGTPTGTTSVEGKIGKARNFSSSADMVQVPSPYVDLPAAWTIDAWFQYPLASMADWNTLARGNTLDHQVIVQRSSMHLGSYDTTGGTFRDSGFVMSALSTGWHHLAAVGTGGSTYFYIDGVKVSSIAFQSTSDILAIGNYQGGTQAWGVLDEVRVSNVARSDADIRAAYEVGKRSHPIMIDFQAKLDSGNLIANTSDLSFTVDARPYVSTLNLGESLYIGDKVIVRENYDGTEYIAQGTVTAINQTTGATTVAAWDSGSTVPASGFTVSAAIFKWQEEWMDVTEPISNQVDAVTRLTLRCIDGTKGRNVYLDDFKAGGPYITDPAATSNVTSTLQRYLQYRAVFSTTDVKVAPYLSGATVNYTAGPTTDQMMRHGRFFSSGTIQPFWWAR